MKNNTVFEYGKNYGDLEKGFVKIPDFMFSTELEQYLNGIDRYIFIIIIGLMQQDKMIELKITINEIASHAGFTINQVKAATDNLTRLGFLRNITAENGQNTKKIHLVLQGLYLNKNSKGRCEE